VREGGRGGGWQKRLDIRQPDLATALRSMNPLLAELGEEVCGISAGGLAGLLSYDLAQWTEPVKLRNLPQPGALLGVLYRCDRWLLHNRSEGTLSLLTTTDDEWSNRCKELVDVWLIARHSPTLKQQHGPDKATRPHHSKPTQASLSGGQYSPSSTISDEEHAELVEKVQAAIEQGQFYQLNFGRIWQGRLDHPWPVFRRLAKANPAPYSGWLQVPDFDFALASASPELMLSIDGDELSTRPIKGTRPRARTRDEDEASMRELAATRKEVSEHMMLVDLERNDIGRVSRVGSVRWNDWRIESHPTVHHMVSEIRGLLRHDLDGWDALQALFPGGSITGCPKTAVVAAIDELEGAPRGAWTGSLGHHDPRTGSACWNLLIRTLEARRESSGGWWAKVQAGGGLVIESDPRQEVEEAKWKAQALLDAAWGSAATQVPTGEMEIRPVPAVNDDVSALLSSLDSQPPSCIAPAEPRRWLPDDPPFAPPAPGTRRLLFIDNLDSFSWNIVHGCSQLGVECIVVEGRGLSVPTDPATVLKAVKPTHIILGPGPGRPSDAPLTLAFAELALAGELTGRPHVRTGELTGLGNPQSGESGWQSGHQPLPLLGLCLGHQALGIAAGWTLSPTPSGAVHGVHDLVSFSQDELFAGLGEQGRVMRYHSLALQQPTDDTSTEKAPNDTLQILATDSETSKIPMAVGSPELPVWGVQFHPESCGSLEGWRILENFLAPTIWTVGESVEVSTQGRRE
jgi:anthranilate/para-aminobenzoate synthase component I/anthranilate/para-aminobenzoate synthase component II